MSDAGLYGMPSGFGAVNGHTEQGLNQSIGTYGNFLDQAKSYLSPYQQAGTNALASYQNLLSNPGSITSNPGYQFQFNQGLNSLQNGAAARGGLLSGNAMKAAQDYGQNYASQSLDQQLGRYSNLMGQGFQASNALGNWAVGTGNNIANAQQRAGAASDQSDANTMQTIAALGMMMCWVAEELYGKYAPETLTIRPYVGKHLNDDSALGGFCRAYLKFGKSWAEDIKNSKWVRKTMRPIWDDLYTQALAESI